MFPVRVCRYGSDEWDRGGGGGFLRPPRMADFKGATKWVAELILLMKGCILYF